MGISVEPTISEGVVGTYTWSALPSASSYPAGTQVRVSNVGASGAGSVWVSTGTAWVPVNGSVVLGGGGVAVTCPNDTAENVLAQVTLPGGALGANGHIDVLVMASFTSSTNEKRLRVRLGATAFLNNPNTTAANVMQNSQVMVSSAGAQNAQVGYNAAAGAGNHWGQSTSAPTTGTENTSADLVVSITGQKNAGAVAASDALILLRWRVILYRTE